MTSGGGSFDIALGPELEAAMAEHRAEVDAIADGPWPPNFDDTIAALEASGGLDIAERLLSYRASACSTPGIRALERYHRDLVRAGATLGEDDRTRLRAINERLSA